MESIIARQKVGRRRRPERAQAARAKPYYPLIGEAPREAAVSGRASKRLGRSSKLGVRPGSRLRGLLAGLRFKLQLSLRSLASQMRGSARTKLAVALGLALGGAAAIGFLIAALARGPAFPLPKTGLLPQEDSSQNLLLDFVSPELSNGAAGDQDSSPLPPAPVTLELSTYTVRAGDSLGAIAKRFGLYIDTIISANGISSASSVKPGTELRIPNINGLILKVRSGDSLAAIAKRYKIDTTRIVDANDLGSSRLVAGQSLFIPGARLPDSAVKQALGQKIAWPLRGPLSSFFGYRPDPFTGIRRFHAGIDIVTNVGTPVRAAMDGRVSDTGYNANYGNYVILNHANGYQTLYGHLTSATVSIGSSLTQGSVLGISGNTGYSTGPHLHFGLFRQGNPLNPLKFLKS